MHTLRCLGDPSNRLVNMFLYGVPTGNRTPLSGVINKYMKSCPKCQTNHSKPGVFCSRVCANSRGPRTDEFKEIVRAKLQKSFNKKCLVCDQLTFKKRKTCSPTCLTTLKKSNPPPKTSGGYRRGSGRGKHGWYRGYYLDSNYELAFLIYCMDHCISIERNKEPFKYTDTDGKVKNFYPDFRVNGKLTEIKGYYTQNLDRKLQAVTEPIDVLFPQDLTHVFRYATNKTGLPVKHLFRLYENSTP